TNLTSGATGGYAWNFGDGNSSTAANPVHTYNVPGSYTVSLAATNAPGMTQDIRPGYVVVLSASSPITFQASGTNMILHWSSGFLQQAHVVTGPWSYVTNATSPFTVGMT